LITTNQEMVGKAIGLIFISTSISFFTITKKITGDFNFIPNAKHYLYKFQFTRHLFGVQLIQFMADIS